ncbi:ankyrin repeat domain-containing protein [Massilia sp. CF038]|uniref:ankyrin repeat domain-containing protein n=1 Tax=Massilia sp. CF038 TaxID=1881045 RepID=UPI0009204E73|nr:ankyrin repeat domain-containing protein [Massilia sp. CF038]SHG67424.1 hypothetical protein/ankyrin [Massilia sp. CF038]
MMADPWPCGLARAALLVCLSLAGGMVLAQDAPDARRRLELMGVQPSAARLVQFAAQGDRTVVELLLRSGVDVNAAEPLRQVRALHNAAAQGRLQLVKNLLARGAQIDARDWRGNTALILAAYGGHAVVVDTLVAHGASLAAVSEEGISVLNAALYSGEDALALRLLAAGARPSVHPVAGATIDIARRAGRQAVVQALAGLTGEAP